MNQRQQVYDEALAQATEEHQQNIDKAEKIADQLDSTNNKYGGGRFLRRLRNKSRKNKKK